MAYELIQDQTELNQLALPASSKQVISLPCAIFYNGATMMIMLLRIIMKIANGITNQSTESYRARSQSYLRLFSFLT